MRGDDADPWGAFVERTPLSFSGTSTSGASTGPLAGVRIAIKDMIAVEGLAWTAGLPLLAARRAAQDAVCVQRLRAAGASIVGVTATDAAGFGVTTPQVRNPIAPGFVAGGSSGGSAAAVAAGMADAALGTDTGGSVRLPAACCGLFGLKPTYGRVPLGGVTGMARSFDHIGVIASDLSILEKVFRVIADGPHCVGEMPHRVGFDPGRLMLCQAEQRRAIEAVLADLQDRGHRLVEVDLPDPFQIMEAHGPIACRESLDVWRENWPQHRDLFGDTAAEAMAYAETVTGDDERRAGRQIDMLRRQLAEVFQSVDALVSATIAAVVPRAGDRYAMLAGAELPLVAALIYETVAYNVSGQPALAVPLDLSASGYPLSLQIVAAHGRDLDALLLAEAICALRLSARRAD